MSNFFIRHSNKELVDKLHRFGGRSGEGFWYSDVLTLLVVEKHKYYCLDDENGNSESLIKKGYIDCGDDERKFLYYASKKDDERILCAAVKRLRPRKIDGSSPYHDGLNDILNIELGFRHHDIYTRFEGELDLQAQGFYTSWGRFVDRYEGMKIAYHAGQVSLEKAIGKEWEDVEINADNIVKYTHEFNMLFSEDLY